MLAQAIERGVDAAEFLHPLSGGAGEREGGFGAVVDRGVGGPGGFLEALHVLQNAPLVLQGRFLVGLQCGPLDLLTLEAPQVEQPELLLFGALEFLEFRRRGAPLVVQGRGAVEQLAVAGESVQHVALRIGRKQKLLLVLSVDIRQMRRQVLEPEFRAR